MRFIGTIKLVRKPSLRSTLPRSGGKPSVMFLRLPPKKLTSTRLPGMVPGMSSKTKQGALSAGGATPATDVRRPGEPAHILDLAELARLLEPFPQIVVDDPRRDVGRGNRDRGIAHGISPRHSNQTPRRCT